MASSKSRWSADRFPAHVEEWRGPDGNVVRGCFALEFRVAAELLRIGPYDSAQDIWGPGDFQLLLVVSEYMTALLEFLDWFWPEMGWEQHKQAIVLSKRLLQPQSPVNAISIPIDPQLQAAWQSFTYCFWHGTRHMPTTAPLGVPGAAYSAAREWLNKLVGERGFEAEGHITGALQTWTKAMQPRLQEAFPGVDWSNWPSVSWPDPECTIRTVEKRGAVKRQQEEEYPVRWPLRVTQGRPKFNHLKVEARDGFVVGIPTIKNPPALGFLAVSDVMCAFKQATTHWSPAPATSAVCTAQREVVTSFVQNVLRESRGPLAPGIAHQPYRYLAYIACCVLGWEKALPQIASIVGASAELGPVPLAFPGGARPPILSQPLFGQTAALAGPSQPQPGGYEPGGFGMGLGLDVAAMHLELAQHPFQQQQHQLQLQQHQQLLQQQQHFLQQQQQLQQQQAMQLQQQQQAHAHAHAQAQAQAHAQAQAQAHAQAQAQAQAQALYLQRPPAAPLVLPNGGWNGGLPAGFAGGPGHGPGVLQAPPQLTGFSSAPVAASAPVAPLAPPQQPAAAPALPQATRTRPSPFAAASGVARQSSTGLPSTPSQPSPSPSASPQLPQPGAVQSPDASQPHRQAPPAAGQRALLPPPPPAVPGAAQAQGHLQGPGPGQPQAGATSHLDGLAPMSLGGLDSLQDLMDGLVASQAEHSWSMLLSTGPGHKGPVTGMLTSADMTAMEAAQAVAATGAASGAAAAANAGAVAAASSDVSGQAGLARPSTTGATGPSVLPSPAAPSPGTVLGPPGPAQLQLPGVWAPQGGAPAGSAATPQALPAGFLRTFDSGLPFGALPPPQPQGMPGLVPRAGPDAPVHVSAPQQAGSSFQATVTTSALPPVGSGPGIGPGSPTLSSGLWSALMASDDAGLGLGLGLGTSLPGTSPPKFKRMSHGEVATMSPGASPSGSASPRSPSPLAEQRSGGGGGAGSGAGPSPRSPGRRPLERGRAGAAAAGAGRGSGSGGGAEGEHEGAGGAGGPFGRRSYSPLASGNRRTRDDVAAAAAVAAADTGIAPAPGSIIEPQAKRPHSTKLPFAAELAPVDTGPGPGAERVESLGAFLTDQQLGLTRGTSGQQQRASLSRGTSGQQQRAAMSSGTSGQQPNASISRGPSAQQERSQITFDVVRQRLADHVAGPGGDTAHAGPSAAGAAQGSGTQEPAGPHPGQQGAAAAEADDWGAVMSAGDMTIPQARALRADLSAQLLQLLHVPAADPAVQPEEVHRRVAELLERGAPADAAPSPAGSASGSGAGGAAAGAGTGSSAGFTALHWACVRGDAVLAELLISHGADPDRTGTAAATPRGVNSAFTPTLEEAAARAQRLPDARPAPDAFEWQGAALGPGESVSALASAAPGAVVKTESGPSPHHTQQFRRLLELLGFEGPELQALTEGLADVERLPPSGESLPHVPAGPPPLVVHLRAAGGCSASQLRDRVLERYSQPSVAAKLAAATTGGGGSGSSWALGPHYSARQLAMRRSAAAAIAEQGWPERARSSGWQLRFLDAYRLYALDPRSGRPVQFVPVVPPADLEGQEAAAAAATVAAAPEANGGFGVGLGPIAVAAGAGAATGMADVAVAAAAERLQLQAQLAALLRQADAVAAQLAAADPTAAEQLVAAALRDTACLKLAVAEIRGESGSR